MRSLLSLRKLREDAALTQHELAERSGVSRSAIARIELGHPPYPSTTRKLAAALGVKPAELMAPAE